MFTKHINLQNFKSVKNNNNIRKDLKLLLEEKNDVINSLSPKYKYSYPKKFILKLKKYSNIRIIGMGGSVLGSESIYNFLEHKIKKKFYFINNLQSLSKIPKKKFVNLIVSKSGNTLETISNVNIHIKKNQKNIFKV